MDKKELLCTLLLLYIHTVKCVFMVAVLMSVSVAFTFLSGESVTDLERLLADSLVSNSFLTSFAIVLVCYEMFLLFSNMFLPQSQYLTVLQV